MIDPHTSGRKQGKTALIKKAVEGGAILATPGHGQPMHPNCRCVSLPPTGYAGQRYEVRAKGYDGKDVGIGWCEDPTGGSLVEAIKMHPSMHSPYVLTVCESEGCQGNSFDGNQLCNDCGAHLGDKEGYVRVGQTTWPRSWHCKCGANFRSGPTCDKCGSSYADTREEIERKETLASVKCKECGGHHGMHGDTCMIGNKELAAKYGRK